MRLAGVVALLLPGCSLLVGFDDPVPGGPSPDAAADANLCGNQALDGTEQCDDGQNVESGPCPHCRFATCGDGYVRTGIEECDPAAPAATCTAACLACNAGAAQLFRAANQHCYSRVDTALDFDSAAADCHAHTAHLVTIRDVTENDEVVGSLGGGFWMGMTDRIVEGTFTWETDEPFAFGNWTVGQPDNGGGAGENCGAMGGPTWDDRTCANPVAYVCEQHPWRVDGMTGHAYLFVPGRYTWDDARAQCNARDADLAVITSAEEASFVASFVEGRVWIGATDLAAEGTFTWANGEPWGYTQWNTGEPNDAMMLENCVTLLGDAGANWIDSPCTTPHPSLCELGG